VTVGSRIELEIGGRSEVWTVVGIAGSGLGPTLYAARDEIMRVNGTGVATVVVRAELRGEGSQLELIGRLRAALAERGHAVSSSVRLVESRRVMEDHLLMVVDMLGAMGWLMLVVGALGLGSTMAIAVLERTREIGVLRAIGARDGAILSLVVVESLAIGLMGWAIALPLSVPMSYALGEAFGRIMVPVASRPLPDAAAVLMWLALVLVVAVLASAWPARRATRVPAARALSYE
jgi:putative ABC transport system permease protein